MEETADRRAPLTPVRFGIVSLCLIKLIEAGEEEQERCYTFITEMKYGTSSTKAREQNSTIVYARIVTSECGEEECGDTRLRMQPSQRPRLRTGSSCTAPKQKSPTQER